MRPLEQYATLRKGREVMRQQDAERWQIRMARLRYGWFRCIHWLALRTIKLGYRLEQYTLQRGETAF